MTLTLNGTQGEIIEILAYSPLVQGGSDLEAATKTISATSEPGAADYSTAHTITAPTDTRIAVLRGCVRLSVTIDSFGGGGTTLNYRVKNGTSSLSTGTLSTGASTGNKLISFDITANITGAQTYTLFFWVDAGTCVLSEVTLWSGVGSMQSSGTNPCLSLSHMGQFELRCSLTRVGTGTFTYYISSASSNATTVNGWMSGSGTSNISFSSSGTLNALHLIASMLYVYMYAPTVATDLPYVYACGAVLRSLI